MKAKSFVLQSVFILLALILSSCSNSDKPVEVESDNGVRYTTVRTTDNIMLIIEPEASSSKKFEPVVVYAGKGPSGTTDSRCYTCWRNYFKCVFSGGTNCGGTDCDAICKAEKGKVLTKSNFSNVREMFKN